MSHKNNRNMGFQPQALALVQGSMRMMPSVASAKREPPKAIQDERPFFTKERAAATRAYVANWAREHYGEISPSAIEDYIASQPPFEV